MSEQSITGLLHECGDMIELRLPLDHRQASTVRVVAASLGADAGFDVDEIDDLRLAVDEAVAVVVEASGSTDTGDEPSDGDGASNQRLRLQFEVSPGAIRVEVGSTGPASGLSVEHVDGLARRILDSVVDRFDVVDGSLVLVKHSSRDGG